MRGAGRHAGREIRRGRGCQRGVAPALADICVAAGRPARRCPTTTVRCLPPCWSELDAVYVSTPHVLHAEQRAGSGGSRASTCSSRKPMVCTVEEALALVAARKASGRYRRRSPTRAPVTPGPRYAQRGIRRGEFGDLVSMPASIWEDWAERYAGQWKQKPEISGGGFMFDTGAHMMNTVCLLADAEFERISAYIQQSRQCASISSRRWPAVSPTAHW